MRWWVSIVLGFYAFGVILILGSLLFVCLGLGYHYPDFANKASKVMFGIAGDTNWSMLLSTLLWTMIFAIVIQIVSFWIKREKLKK